MCVVLAVHGAGTHTIMGQVGYLPHDGMGTSWGRYPCNCHGIGTQFFMGQVPMPLRVGVYIPVHA